MNAEFAWQLGPLPLVHPHHNNRSIPPGPHSTSVYTGVLFFREDVGEVPPQGMQRGL